MQRQVENNYHPHLSSMARPPYPQMHLFPSQYPAQTNSQHQYGHGQHQTIHSQSGFQGYHHFAPLPSFHPRAHNPYTAAYGAGYPPPTSARYTSTIFEDETQAETVASDPTTSGPRKAQPRRRVSLMPSKNSDRQSIAIAEDATATLPRIGAYEDGIFQSETTGPALATSGAKRQSLSAMPPRRRRVSTILADRLALVEDELEENKKLQNTLKKEARRKTIYIPDDTTVMTIHPGNRMAQRVQDHSRVAGTRDEKVAQSHRRLLSPDSGLDLVTLSEGPESPYPVLKHSSIELGVKKSSRKSLAVPPKRVPLSQMKRASRNVSFADGANAPATGKENIAPGSRGIAKPLVKPLARPIDDMAKARLSIAGLKMLTPEKADTKLGTSPGKRKGTDSILNFSPKSTKIKTSKAAARADALVGSLLSGKIRPARTTLFEEAVEEKVVPRSHIATKPHTALAEKVKSSTTLAYKVLSEDLAHPSLYEDHWLEHQEIALSQLLNDIYEPQQVYKEPPNTKALRKCFLNSYHDPQFPSLYKRLQASLQYGALSIPSDLLTKSSRLRDDVGLKKNFLSLWVETYDHALLRAALEVIVGREMPQLRLSGAGKAALSTSHMRLGSTSSIDSSKDGHPVIANADLNDRKKRAEKRSLENFIDAFFIRHEDATRPTGTIASIARVAEQKSDDFGSQAWAWRRTVLRSLMLILLLDKTKSGGAIQTCLFQATSTHKSSAAVLTTLSGHLLPSLGNLPRALSHLNYELGVIQYPLQQYEYRIANLATDLRDGVKLTRLIELMLFNKAMVAGTSKDLMDNTITLSLPTGDVLTSNWTHDPAAEWILSQHLKFPCAGRIQKIYNVQIALSALHALSGAAAIASRSITAEDIVDGHRERTLTLLWAIMGHYGLGRLVDWKELKREVRHFRLLAREGYTDIAESFLEAKDSNEAVEHAPSMERCSKLLLAWAQSIAALKGLQVTNLTTSFSDARVLDAVVEAYLSYIPTAAATAISVPNTQACLSAKLKAIGCSIAFIDLFATLRSSNIPSKAFTISSLTFLASRLIPLSRTHRAAVILQRAVRSRQRKTDITHRVALARLAHHCAMVVQTRERVVQAAMVLQRAWRSVQHARAERLLRNIVGMQSTSRGWIVRQKIKGRGRIQGRRIAGW